MPSSGALPLRQRATCYCGLPRTAAASTSSSSPVHAGSSSLSTDARQAAKDRIAAVDAAARQVPLKTGPGGAPAGVKQIVAVSSGKGGVGKSTTSVNLALSLSALGLRVGLLDADVYGPSIPQLMNLSGQPFLNRENKMIPLENYGIQVMSIGFLVDSPEDRYKPIIWRGPMLQKALHQLLHDVAWNDVDILLVDMPPGTGDVQITITQRAGLAGAVVVSTPHDLALLDARRGLRMFEQLKVPILGIVENMSGYACSSCGHTAIVFGQRDGARKAAEESGVEFLGAVPLMPVAIGGSRSNDESDSGTRMPLAWEPGNDPAVHDSDGSCGTDTSAVVRQLSRTIEAAADSNDWPKVVELSTQIARSARLQLGHGSSGSVESANTWQHARGAYMSIAERVADKLGLVGSRAPTSQ